jgi:hypothetical protein
MVYSDAAAKCQNTAQNENIIKGRITQNKNKNLKFYKMFKNEMSHKENAHKLDYHKTCFENSVKLLVRQSCSEGGGGPTNMMSFAVNWSGNKRCIKQGLE